jgi:hypothetical protein
MPLPITTENSKGHAGQMEERRGSTNEKKNERNTTRKENVSCVNQGPGVYKVA